MEDFVPTRAAQKRQNDAVIHNTVTYIAPKKKKPSERNQLFKLKTNDNSEEDSDLDNNETQEEVDPRRQRELEMKKLRYEVMKFGASGFENSQAKKLKMQMLINLGATPPKNRKQNYKKILVERKAEKMRAKKKEKFASGIDAARMAKLKTQNFKSKTQKGNKKHKKEGEFLKVYGKVKPESNKKAKFKKRRK